MPTSDPQRLETANGARTGLALENEITAIQARSYVRCLQIGWQVNTIGWNRRESEGQLTDARSLLQAAEIFAEIEGHDAPRAIDCYRRAGEVLEWLARSADDIRTIAPIELLSGAAFQLGGLPAMASSLLGQFDFEEDGPKLFAAFLKADFDAVLVQAMAFWAQNGDLTDAGSSLRILKENKDDQLSWYFTVELIRALGLFADSIRRGDDGRLAKATAKLKALDAMALRTFSDDVSLLISLLRQVGERFAGASIYRSIRALGELNLERMPRMLAFARDQFSRGRGILWSSQRAGLTRLLENSSFALCTPTGSGKTLIANLALLKELLLGDHEEVVPLALYLVPSRALAGEVEAKLTSELGRDFIITGLYGGADWGITDYWLNADRPTVLIATVEKADAFMRYLAPLLLSRLKILIVDEAHQVLPEDTESGRSDFAEHSSRSLRLEGFVARLLTQVPDIARIALTAVAGGAAGPVARWMEGTADAAAIGTRYRSTRQVIGVLETASERRSTMLLELMNGRPLYVQGRDDPVYLNLSIPPMAQLPAPMRSSLNRFNQVTVLWTSLHLAATNRRILISLAQQPEQTMGWYAEAFDLPAWQGLPAFVIPEGRDGDLFAEARATGVDYCGPDSYEVRLLDRGIATSHGQMPQRLRRLMVALIEDKICPITVATATLTEGVNLPFDIIFVTSLKRSAYDNVKQQPVVTPFTPAEFRNLSGRAGRPGSTRGMEGLTLIALPTTIATTANGQKQTQRNQMAALRADYEALRENLRLDELAGDATLSPLAMLLRELRDKARLYFGHLTDNAFLKWLEQIEPGAISDDAGTGATGDIDRLADTVDELDAFIITALQELSLLDAELDGLQAEAKLAALWQKTFTVAAAAQEAWLEEAIVRRGRAIVEDIYPDPDERRRLYQYGFSPYVGRRFELTAPAIAELLTAAVDYGAETPAQRLVRFEALGELLKVDRGFGFRVRDTVGDREILEAWTAVLRWWMRAPGSEVPEAGDLRARQRFVADNLEFRLGVAIGAVVAQKWNAGAGDPLAVPSLTEWKATTGLPWFGFWARELLRWGTLDPIVAFALAQGRAKTREDAEALRPAFAKWLDDEIDAPTSEDLIDPQHFLAWERTLPAREREHAEVIPEEAELTGTTGAMKSYNVLPVVGASEVIWLDASGYKLARSPSESRPLDRSDLADDYLLDADGPATVRRVFTRSRRE
ncbi:DEAD/DEAH box helicase [Rubrimonas cliftonensis]|uniref:DEAD/DEAH box helicase n=1 Tax=Rubrimonas cliftonensis TaxID=89524 RepID=A0A1H4FG23_9RHOB|nr:DEAD/DEAH box helicase [Rubrimonas cliftonensis]SEA96225.1 DEAD/DEAH box helicase [Rubrimonas cliftonensis]